MKPEKKKVKKVKEVISSNDYLNLLEAYEYCATTLNLIKENKITLPELAKRINYDVSGLDDQLLFFKQIYKTEL